MIRNYLAAAFRNMIRNRLYAAISIVGLAVGMAAAILTGLYIRDELTFDRFIPGHDKVYVLISKMKAPARGEMVIDLSPAQAAAWLKLDFPGAQVARWRPEAAVSVRHGEVEAMDTIASVDADFFSVLPLPVLAGDPRTGLRAPGRAVITRAMARKYFGRDDPIGETLELDRETPVRVTAVLKDLPSATHLTSTIFISGTTNLSGLQRADAQTYARGAINVDPRTYVRFPDDRQARAAIAAMPGFLAKRMQPVGGWGQGGSIEAELTPLGGLHLYPYRGDGVPVLGPRGNPAVLVALAAIAVLIVLVASANFINLMTARATRRSLEVGVRKTAGAERGHLFRQFIGEAMIYAVLGMVAAMALVEVALPAMNAALSREIRFDYWRDPMLAAGLVLLTAVIGFLAGSYPALVLSALRPSAALKPGSAQVSGSPAVRQGLVTMQFAVLIGLILAVLVIQRQTRFALDQGVAADGDAIIVADLDTRGPPLKPACVGGAFIERVRLLPGVRDAACGSRGVLGLADGNAPLILPDGRPAIVGIAVVDFSTLDFYGVKPIAGRGFSADHPGDALPADGPRRQMRLPPTIVVNRTAVAALGLGSPEQAVGATIKFAPAPDVAQTVQIVGVVPDFTIDLVHGAMRPMIYFVDPLFAQVVHIKLAGSGSPRTLAAIDRLWREVGQPRAFPRRFLDDTRRELYLETIRQGWLVSALAVIAIFIAALGLFGLAAFTAERRTKEIGVRKAMGASSGDILGLLLWQFSRPVLWANLIAWPAAWWALNRWLSGFSSRIALEPWLFLAAAGGALAIALVTVFAHALKVARAKPIQALRYE